MHPLCSGENRFINAKTRGSCFDKYLIFDLSLNYAVILSLLNLSGTGGYLISNEHFAWLVLMDYFEKVIWNELTVTHGYVKGGLMISAGIGEWLVHSVEDCLGVCVCVYSAVLHPQSLSPLKVLYLHRDFILCHCHRLWLGTTSSV